MKFPLMQLLFALVVVCCVLVAMVVYALLDNQPPITDATGVSMKPVYRPGEVFHGVRSLTITRSCDGYKVRWLSKQDDKDWIVRLPGMPVYPEHIEDRALPRRSMTDAGNFHIPDWVETGEYAYHGRYVFYCNLAQRWLGLPVILDLPVIEFDVLKPGQAAPETPGEQP